MKKLMNGKGVAKVAVGEESLDATLGRVEVTLQGTLDDIRLKRALAVQTSKILE